MVFINRRRLRGNADSRTSARKNLFLVRSNSAIELQYPAYAGKNKDKRQGGHEKPREEENRAEYQDNEFHNAAAYDYRDAHEKTYDARNHVDGDVLEDEFEVESGSGSGWFVDTEHRSEERLDKKRQGKEMIKKPKNIFPEHMEFVEGFTEMPVKILYYEFSGVH